MIIKMNKKNEKTYQYPDISAYEEKIGYKYKNKHLLETALTHSSFTNEQRAKRVTAYSNERLEFLGDSVLSLITTEYIYNKFRDFPEGELTRIRSGIVCENMLCEFSKAIGIGDMLFLGNGESASNGRSRKSILADAFEAVLGSIYLDGGLETTVNFLMKFIERPVEDILKEGAVSDYKTLLQQVIQQNQGESLRYNLTSETGPDHGKVFEIEALLGSNVIGRGKGSSKRDAEQNAAKEALLLFGYQF